MVAIQDYGETISGGSIGSVCDGIEFNIWQAEKHFQRGALRHGRECLLLAWSEYAEYQDILAVYAGSELADKLSSVMLQHGVRPESRRFARGRTLSQAALTAA